MAVRKRTSTANEILDVLEESDDEFICIEPPDTHELTDEDSASSDDEENHSQSALSGRHLFASARIHTHDNVSRNDTNDNEPLPWQQKIAHKFDSKKEIFVEFGCPKFPESNLTEYKNFSPREFFELFFDEEVFNHITEQTNLYALQKSLPNAAITRDELKVFFAILMISGYSYSTSKRDYWCNGDDVRNYAIYNSMRCNRFDQIMGAIHFQDNLNLDYSDRYSKLRPLIALMQRRFMKHYVLSQNISHDKAMVEYFGKRGCKQLTRSKAIRLGYKIWCQNSASGYLINFEPYQGKVGNCPASSETDKFGSCAAAALRLLSQSPKDEINLPNTIFCDDFFTTLPLLLELKSLGYNCMGTIKDNCIPKGCKLSDVEEMPKEPCDSYANIIGTMHDGNQVILTRWKDDFIVNVSSISTSQNCKRVCVAKEGKKEATSVDFIRVYDRCMGGTDQMDKNINKYRVCIRGKKWWWCLFTWILDVAIHNAWNISQQIENKTTQKQFRRAIALYYVKQYGTPPQHPGRKPSSTADQRDLRYDQLSHFVKNVDGKKRRRCAMEGCKSVGRTECSKCDVGLCISCFIAYHTK